SRGLGPSRLGGPRRPPRRGGVVGDRAPGLRPDQGHRRDQLSERAARLRRSGVARQQPLVRAPLLADRQRRADRALPAPRPGRLRLHAADEPGARASRLAAGLPRLPPPRFHERDRVQPDRRDASHAPREVHDARAVDDRARPLRPDRGARRERVHVTRYVATPLPSQGSRPAWPTTRCSCWSTSSVRSIASGCRLPTPPWYGWSREAMSSSVAAITETTEPM